VGHYRVNNGRPGHTNGTGCALWSSANEVHDISNSDQISDLSLFQLSDITI